MCGIVGAVAERDIVPMLIEGLRRLEYRGYDSCGVAVSGGGRVGQAGPLRRARTVSRVADLDAQVRDTGLTGTTGICHTRWATHGAPVTVNAHPIYSRDAIAVVHNGIIENFERLRTRLQGQGYVFDTQTDTEVIAHLVNSHYSGDLAAAVRLAMAELEGAYAIAVFCKAEPGRVVGARHGNPLVVGVGKGENFLASDALALAGTTDQIVYLEEGDLADIQLQRYAIVDRHGLPVQREVRTVKVT